jgi:hypothetical protein
MRAAHARPREAEVNLGLLLFFIFAPPLSLAQQGLQAFVERVGNELTIQPPRTSSASNFSIYPSPIIVTDQDYERMQRASEQRARAGRYLLRALFKSPEELSQIIPLAWQNRFRERYRGRNFDPNKINFILGIDILRGRDGSMRVIEDNYSVAAGIWIADWIQDQIPTAFALPESNLEGINSVAIDMLGPAGGDARVVNLQYDLYTVSRYFDSFAEHFSRGQRLIQARNETNRIHTIYLGPMESFSSWLRANIGFGISGNHARNLRSGAMEALQVIDDRLVLIEQRGSEQRLLNVGVLWPHILNEHLFEYLPGLPRVIAAGNVALLQSPGVDVLDSKLLQIFIDDIIINIFHEKPAIPFASSRHFIDQEGKFDPSILEGVLAAPENWIIKPIGLQGGEGLYFARELLGSNSALESLRRSLARDPFSYIAQEILSSSVVPGRRFETSRRKIDFRAFSVAHSRIDDGVRSDRTRALPNIYSRGVPEGSRTHNVTGNSGKVTLQAVLPAANYCSGLMTGKLDKL